MPVCKFKSGLEQKLARQLEQLGVSYAYELHSYDYEQVRKYTPDFFLPNGIIIEAKGKFTPEDRRKHLDIKRQYPELDIRFVFQRNNFIRKGSKIKYSDWAIKHDYQYSIGQVPEKWIKEKKKG